MGTIDVSKHATFKQLKALYDNRHGNSIVGSKAEYNTESVQDRLNELAIKQADAMAKQRQVYEADINNYPTSWDNVNDNGLNDNGLNDNDSHLEVSDLEVSSINISFKFKNTIWHELTSDSKDYWANLMIS